MTVPSHIIDAAKHGEIPPVEAWLDREDSDVNAFDANGSTLLLECVASPTGSRDAEGLCRLLLARGADPNLCGTGSGERYPPRSSRGGIPPLWEAAYHRKHLCKLLIGAGANVEARASGWWSEIIPNIDEAYQATLLGNLLYFIGGDALVVSNCRLDLIYMLLQAGARTESIVKPHASDETYSAAWCLEQGIARWRQRPYLYRWSLEEHVADKHNIAIKVLIAGMRQDGSYKSYVRRPHRLVLRLRSLFPRGRAKLKKLRRRPRGRDARADGAIAFIVKLGDNGIIWNVLSFWKDATTLKAQPCGCREEYTHY